MYIYIHVYTYIYILFYAYVYIMRLPPSPSKVARRSETCSYSLYAHWSTWGFYCKGALQNIRSLLQKSPAKYQISFTKELSRKKRQSLGHSNTNAQRIPREEHSHSCTTGGHIRSLLRKGPAKIRSLLRKSPPRRSASYLFTYVQTYVHTQTRTHARAHTHTHIHTHLHTIVLAEDRRCGGRNLYSSAEWWLRPTGNSRVFLAKEPFKNEICQLKKLGISGAYK